MECFIHSIQLLVYCKIFSVIVSRKCNESEKLVTQLCLTLCDSMDCSPPGSFVHGILQARILEWVAFPSRESSQHRDRTQVSCIDRQILYHLSHQGSPEYLFA